MRNQSKYNEKERGLNPTENRILQEIEKSSGLNIPARAVMYERHTPRATLCTVFLAKWWDIIARQTVGVTIRSKNDKEDPEAGQHWAFRRALEDYVERKKHAK